MNMRHRPDSLAFVIFGKADPHHCVAAVFDYDLVYLMQISRFVSDMCQGEIAVATGLEYAIEFEKAFLLAPAPSCVAGIYTEGVEHRHKMDMLLKYPLLYPDLSINQAIFFFVPEISGSCLCRQAGKGRGLLFGLISSGFS